MGDRMGDRINELQIPPVQSNYLKQSVIQRWNFIKSNCHLMGYILDPRYSGRSLLTQDKNNAILLIKNYQLTPDYTPEKIQIELDDYIIHVRSLGVNQEPIRDPIAWWYWFGDNYPLLSAMAQRVMNLIPSTSSVERSFKSRGHIHTKNRNRLRHDTCTKLTSIRMNAHLLPNNTLQVKRKMELNPMIDAPIEIHNVEDSSDEGEEDDEEDDEENDHSKGSPSENSDSGI